MKDMILTSLKQLTSHRRLLFLLLGLLVLSIVVVSYMAATIESNDLRIITQYTAYGLTHFYRSSWTYLFSFIVFVVLCAVFTIGITLKMLHQDREPLALLIGWMGIVIVSTTLVMYVHIGGLI